MHFPIVLHKCHRDVRTRVWMSDDEQRVNNTKGEAMERRGSITTGTVFLVVLCIAAWTSNPDEEHFERWLGRRAATVAEGRWERLASRVALHAADWERTNYGFCSLVMFHDPGPVRFLGAFGNWWVLPSKPDRSDEQ